MTLRVVNLKNSTDAGLGKHLSGEIAEKVSKPPFYGGKPVDFDFQRHRVEELDFDVWASPNISHF